MAKASAGFRMVADDRSLAQESRLSIIEVFLCSERRELRRSFVPLSSQVAVHSVVRGKGYDL